jgi:2-polyprenyl-6-hydroxyphenyl methylase/3-demethylubiquinone-9 3-methyltransferase
MSTTQDFAREVAGGQRFRFGQNWRRFLAQLDNERIAEAAASLESMLEIPLAGRTFIDVGSGSGLFSLGAMRLGAAQVYSLDYDPDSVACSRELKKRYFPDAQNWAIAQASALDADFLAQIGLWDVVYSWGVLHHTGNMWQAIENVTALVKDNGLFFLSIYNDQGRLSQAWKAIKRFYNKHWIWRILILCSYIPAYILAAGVRDLIRLRNPISRYASYKQLRGMSMWNDWLDWLGGYPFEVATPEAIRSFLEQKGFKLQKMKLATSGCNEFVFCKN